MDYELEKKNEISRLSLKYTSCLHLFNYLNDVLKMFLIQNTKSVFQLKR